MGGKREKSRWRKGVEKVRGEEINAKAVTVIGNLMGR
jgi:hypothetical protein